MRPTPSRFVQAHRLVSAALAVPFRQWRLALVILVVTYLPMVLLLLALSPAVFVLMDTIYGPDAAFFEAGPSFALYMAVLGVLYYPLIVWSLVIWWRSQGGAIKVLAPFQAVWCTGVIYLIPTLVSVISTGPAIWAITRTADNAALPSDAPIWPVALASLATYWLTYRLAPALVNTALGRDVLDQKAGLGAQIAAGWRKTRPDNKLCLLVALNLTFYVVIIETLVAAATRFSAKSWGRVMEAPTRDVSSLMLFDSVTAGLETLVLTWLIFVDLALVWTLSQRSSTQNLDNTLQ